MSSFQSQTKSSKWAALLSVCFVLVGSSLRADQPIFNEMPRWNNGWGIQGIYEFAYNPNFMDGDSVVANDLSESIQQFHLEGVYTWKRWIRITAKIPYVIHAERELPSPTGPIKQTDEGLGDITLALPLKKYFNLDGRSGSWTFAPQLRIPTASKSGYDVYNREWGNALSVGYETETYRFVFAAGTSFWIFYGDEPSRSDTSLDFGLNFQMFGSNGSIKWKNRFRYEVNGTAIYNAGPSLYYRFTDTVHGQLEWRHEFYGYFATPDHGNGDQIRAGIAFVF